LFFYDEIEIEEKRGGVWNILMFPAKMVFLLLARLIAKYIED